MFCIYNTVGIIKIQKHKFMKNISLSTLCDKERTVTFLFAFDIN